MGMFLLCFLILSLPARETVLVTAGAGATGLAIIDLAVSVFQAKVLRCCPFHLSSYAPALASRWPGVTVIQWQRTRTRHLLGQTPEPQPWCLISLLYSTFIIDPHCPLGQHKDPLHLPHGSSFQKGVRVLELLFPAP